MNKKSIIKAFLPLLFFVLLFSSCRSVDSSGEAPIFVCVPGFMKDAYVEVFKSTSFSSECPYIEVIVEEEDTGCTRIGKLRELTHTVEVVEKGYFTRFVRNESLLDYNEAPFGFKDDAKKLAAASLYEYTSLDGNLKAIPISTGVGILYYRLSAVQNAGIDFSVRMSWDEFLKKCKKLTIDKNNDGVIDQFALANPYELSYAYLKAAGGGWFSKGKPLFPKEKYIRCMELVKKTTESGICAAYLSWSGEWINSFKEGKVVLAISGDFLAKHMKEWLCPDLKGDWSVTFLPGPDYCTFSGYCAIIPPIIEEKRRLKAWKVVRFLATNQYAQTELFKRTGVLPALASLYDQKLLNEENEYLGGQRVYSLYASILEKTPVSYITADDGIALDCFNIALKEMVDGKIPVEEAYGLASKRILEQIEKHNPK